MNTVNLDGASQILIEDLQARNAELQAVVDRLASKERMRPPLSGCCNEVDYRIEYAANHATKGGG